MLDILCNFFVLSKQYSSEGIGVQYPTEKEELEETLFKPLTLNKGDKV